MDLYSYTLSWISSHIHYQGSIFIYIIRDLYSYTCTLSGISIHINYQGYLVINIIRDLQLYTLSGIYTLSGRAQLFSVTPCFSIKCDTFELCICKLFTNTIKRFKEWFEVINTFSTELVFKDMQLCTSFIQRIVNRIVVCVVMNCRTINMRNHIRLKHPSEKTKGNNKTRKQVIFDCL